MVASAMCDCFNILMKFTASKTYASFCSIPPGQNFFKFLSSDFLVVVFYLTVAFWSMQI